MDYQKPFYDPFSSAFNFSVFFFLFLAAMIRFLFVLGNFLEDSSETTFCDVGIPHLKITLKKPKDLI